MTPTHEKLSHRKGDNIAYLYYIMSTLHICSQRQWRLDGRPNPFQKRHEFLERATRSDIADLIGRTRLTTQS